MANLKITQLDPLGGSPAPDDLFEVIDVSDNTMSPEGTNKKVRYDELGIAVDWNAILDRPQLVTSASSTNLIFSDEEMGYQVGEPDVPVSTGAFTLDDADEVPGIANIIYFNGGALPTFTPVAGRTVHNFNSAGFVPFEDCILVIVLLPDLDYLLRVDAPAIPVDTSGLAAKDLDIIVVSTDTYTLTSANFRAYTIFTSATPVTITVPPGLVNEYNYGFFRQQGAGGLNFVEGAGVNINGPQISTDAIGSNVQLVEIATNNYDFVVGGGGGGSTDWGDIGGTLSNQTDLQNALNAKLDAINVSGAVNQVAGFVGPDAIGGSAGLTYDGITLQTDGDIVSTKDGAELILGEVQDVNNTIIKLGSPRTIYTTIENDNGVLTIGGANRTVFDADVLLNSGTASRLRGPEVAIETNNLVVAFQAQQGRVLADGNTIYAQIRFGTDLNVKEPSFMNNSGHYVGIRGGLTDDHSNLGLLVTAGQTANVLEVLAPDETTVRAFIANDGAISGSSLNTNSILTLSPYTFGLLPASPVEGDVAFITDGASVSYRGIASGGGSETVMVFYDGTNWLYH